MNKYKPSKSERYFGKRFREIFGVKLKSSYRLGGKIFDYRVPNKDILIELDGRFWHSLKEAKENDKEKDKIASNNGYKLLRFELNSIAEVDNLIAKNHKLFEQITKQDKNTNK